MPATGTPTTAHQTGTATSAPGARAGVGVGTIAITGADASTGVHADLPGLLAAAEDPATAPLDRLRLLAAFADRMDGWLATAQPHRRPGTAPQALPAGNLRHLAARHAACFADQVRPAMAAAGLRLVDWGQLAAHERGAMHRYFERQVLPLLVPMALDAARPFPRIRDRSLNLAVVVAECDGELPCFARVEIPAREPRLVALPDDDAGQQRYIPIEQVVAAHLGQLFHGVRVVEHHRFRVTWQQAPGGAGHRRPARLEVSTTIGDWVLALLTRHLRAPVGAVWRLPDPLDLGALRHAAAVGTAAAAGDTAQDPGIALTVTGVPGAEDHHPGHAPAADVRPWTFRRTG